jgi:hypothetical protein
MKRIKLTHEKFALVDDDDYEVLSQYHWQARKKRNTWYAQRGCIRGGKETTQRMHRAILGLIDPAIFVDHINGDGLDNRRSNLRIATVAQNNHNSRKPRNNRSGFKGVSQRKGFKQWHAYIYVGNSQVHLGFYDDPEFAAMVYDSFAKQLFGEFFRPNFPENFKGSQN